MPEGKNSSQFHLIPSHFTQIYSPSPQWIVCSYPFINQDHLLLMFLRNYLFLYPRRKKCSVGIYAAVVVNRFILKYKVKSSLNNLLFPRLNIKTGLVPNFTMNEFSRNVIKSCNFTHFGRVVVANWVAAAAQCDQISTKCVRCKTV